MSGHGLRRALARVTAGKTRDRTEAVALLAARDQELERDMSSRGTTMLFAGPGLPCGPRRGPTLRTRTNGRGRVACATAASTCCARTSTAWRTSLW